MEKKRSKLPIIIGIVLVPVIALGITAYVLYGMATSTENESKLNTTPSTDILEPLMYSVLFGKEQEITNEQINGLLAHGIALQNKEPKDTAKVKIENITIYLHEKKSNEVYISVLYQGIKLIISAETDIALNKEQENIAFTLQDTKLGTLPISAQWVMEQLKASHAFAAVSDSIQIEENTIHIPTSYSISESGASLSIEITKLQPKEGGATIQTSGAMSQLKDFFAGLLD